MKPSDILARAAQRAAHAKPSNTEPWFKLATAKADGGTPSRARLQIYGVIGDWWEGTDASTLATSIQELEVDEIEVHLNSPGGLAFDGIAIFNALRQHDAKVRVVVDGLAASAASIIAMAGDEVIMALGSEMMIHDSAGLCWGQAKDMRQVADWLDKLDVSMAGVYRSRAGGTVEDWQAVMDAETWYTAEEAVAAGLADGVDKAKEADDPEAAFDLSAFAYAGRSHAPKPVLPAARKPATHIPPAEPVEHPQPSTEGTATMPEILTSGLRERLGISADAELDDAGYLAAVDEALAELAEPTNTAPGTVLIDEGALAELQASAALGRAAHERQVAADREAAITSAVSTGRIPAARADAWRTQLTADPGAVEVLNSLPENTVPMKPVGYTGGVEASTDDDVDVRESTAYKNWSM